eukprot:CAMPEP_0202966150 /NCGR_PEP_ID=MMETSP1396-20130829/10425_1 /ASSEMBLY_ACC=CAM_ASM_000872 /TAXON_ID= /ORGANISM="Pseudokeronopsis sp., Strain Brazil" /LENGTH=55 /DNA_ID=CAMNT_0049689655 /DNA_START=1145 /DNA_END=1312 /DNA_ORIENTATION=-
MEESSIENALQEVKKLYTNMNVEVEQHTANNRLNLLLEDFFHVKFMLKEIEQFKV